jgi:hypothetical protein
LLRFGIAIPALVFGLEHFLHPTFVPVVPLRLPMPTWIPGRVSIGYLTGAVLLASGATLILNWQARASAAALGIFAAVVVLAVYGPLLVAEPSVTVGLNFFADTLAYSGAVLVLASALPKGASR